MLGYTYTPEPALQLRRVRVRRPGQGRHSLRAWRMYSDTQFTYNVERFGVGGGSTSARAPHRPAGEPAGTVDDRGRVHPLARARQAAHLGHGGAAGVVLGPRRPDLRGPNNLLLGRPTPTTCACSRTCCCASSTATTDRPCPGVSSTAARRSPTPWASVRAPAARGVLRDRRGVRPPLRPSMAPPGRQVLLLNSQRWRHSSCRTPVLSAIDRSRK
jgi:hypothetical protein